MSVITREALPKEGPITPEIPPFLKMGDSVYFDPVPNLRISRAFGYKDAPRKYYPKKRWYTLLKDPYLEDPVFDPNGECYQFKIQNLESDSILGAVFGDHWFDKYRLANPEPTQV